MRIAVYGPLRSATGGKDVDLRVGDATVREVVTALVEAYPRAAPYLYDEEGTVRPSVRVAVNGTRAELDDSCPSDATVSLFPAVQGGRGSGR